MTDRNAMLAKVHIAKKELALDDDTYRAVVERVTGKASAGACSPAALDALLKEFRRLGWKHRPRKGRADDRQSAKIRALWADLAGRAGGVRDGSAAGLRAWVEGQTGKSDLRFCSPEERSRLIEGLKAWRDRAPA